MTFRTVVMLGAGLTALALAIPAPASAQSPGIIPPAQKNETSSVPRADFPGPQRSETRHSTTGANVAPGPDFPGPKRTMHKSKMHQ